MASNRQEWLFSFLVMFVFLQDWRATLIPAIVVPIALGGACLSLYLFGFSIYLEVLDAQRNLISVQQQLLQLRATELQNGMSLYIALGGGQDAASGNPSIKAARQ